ncbi:hypothetical protein HanIR_Chr03g0120141 [Helianthus annuus]|nr:hypothetical protein HanIR_Chr03g0120141 [Helianthus annuus]
MPGIFKRWGLNVKKRETTGTIRAINSKKKKKLKLFNYKSSEIYQIAQSGADPGVFWGFTGTPSIWKK